MTKAKTKTKKIILLVVATLLVLLILLGCVILWVPGFWHPIDYFSQYEGMLDSPITEITLWHGGYDVTFSDPDLLNSWEKGLEQLQLQKNGVQLLSAGGGKRPGGDPHRNRGIPADPGGGRDDDRLLLVYPQRSGLLPL